MVQTMRAERVEDLGGLAPRAAATTVVVVDDHRTFAELLRFALDAAAELECVGTAGDIETGLALVAHLHPDVVVMDVDFGEGGRDGVTAAAAILSQTPDVKVVLLTGHPTPSLAQRAANAGASCLLAKDGSLPDLIDALLTTRGAGLMVHSTFLRAQLPGRQAAPLGPALSNREQDVLAMLALGLGASEIADKLGISKNTCRGYIKSLLWKLDAHTQLEAVAKARRLGMVCVTVLC